MTMTNAQWREVLEGVSEADRESIRQGYGTLIDLQKEFPLYRKSGFQYEPRRSLNGAMRARELIAGQEFIPAGTLVKVPMLDCDGFWSVGVKFFETILEAWPRTIILNACDFVQSSWDKAQALQTHAHAA